MHEHHRRPAKANLKLLFEDPPCSDFFSASAFLQQLRFCAPPDESYLGLRGGFLELKLQDLRCITAVDLLQLLGNHACAKSYSDLQQPCKMINNFVFVLF
jgi:hypothetical protein